MENGIDIPNANTIIINQAQKFGLSDLHQLRGRVGRSNVKAYCYLVVPPIASLTEDARRRIRAIEAFSDLGSGFNIAMQDLDIRGAGNLLGAEQSGFIAEMGFETYMRILNEAMAELPLSIKAEEEANREHQVKQAHIPVLPKSFTGTVDTQVETDLEVLIPDDYVNVQSEKIRLYKELDTMSQESELERFKREAEDRFGPVPPQLEELMDVVRLRREAQKLGIERVVLKNNIMLCYFVSNQMSPFYTSSIFEKVLGNVQKYGSRFQVKESNGKLYFRADRVETVKQAVQRIGMLSEGI